MDDQTNKNVQEVQGGVVTRTALLNLLEDLSKTRVELEKAKDYLGNIIKSMVDTLIVVDPDGKIQAINKATEELLGYKESELIGKPVATIFEEEEEEELLFKGTQLEKLIKEGSVKDYDMTYLTKAKERIPVSFSGSVMKDKDGKLVGIVGIARDMREIKRLMEIEKEAAVTSATVAVEKARAKELENAYKKLRDTQNELMIRHQAMEASMGGIAITDMKGKLTDVNWAFLFLWGYKKEKDVIGKNITDFWAQENDEQPENLLRRVKEKGIWKGELKGIRKDGTRFWVDVNGSLLLDREDSPVGMTYFFTDTAERKQTEEKMREASKMTALGQFVAGAAHEINNPLSVITMVSQDLIPRFKEISPEMFGKKELKNLIKDLEMINKQGMRCGGITQNLLTFARKEKDAEKVPTSMNKVLGEVLGMIGHQLELSKIKVIAEKKRMSPVLANSSRINQCFMNILLNARQSMPKGGKLTLKSEKLKVGDKDYVKVEIADTGEGISSKNLKRVFEPFFTTRKVGAGTGLGLSIAYSIIKEHGGDIDIDSELGKGTTVSITLPAIQT